MIKLSDKQAADGMMLLARICGWISYLLTTGILLAFAGWTASLPFTTEHSIYVSVMVIFAAAMFLMVWFWMSLVLWSATDGERMDF